MSDFQSKRFGKYLLLDTIATGGMAQLYLAKIIGIQGFEKLIAIKKILPHIAQERELVSSFIDEAKLAALLNHQNVVQIYDFGSMEDSYFISMEYLFGKDLRAMWNKAKEKSLPISLENALYIVSRICAGLAYAHELKDFQGKPLNIIHRDISPQNIFVTYQGDVKILDFGIAKAASQSTVTQFGMIKGKVAYMSPEQAAGKAIDQRSDLFSTGILLYELVTQNRMFTGESTIQILTKVRDDEYDSPESVAVGLPPRICAILNRAVAKEPGERYQSCSEMLADLEECMIELSLRPTGRALARYMKELFGEEIENEDRAIRELSGLGRVQEPEPQPIAADQGAGTEAGIVPQAGESPQTGVMPRIAEPEGMPEQAEPPDVQVAEAEPEGVGGPPLGKEKRAKSTLLYAAMGVVIVVVGLGLALWPRGKGLVSPAPEKPEAATSTAAPSPPAPTETAQAKAESEEQQRKAQENVAKAKALREEAGAVLERSPQKAKSLLLEAVKSDPASAEGYFRLGLTYVKLKDYPNAIDTYGKVAAMDPEFPDIYFNLGFAYAMNKDYPKAEEMYDKVVKLAPRYIDEALFNLALVQEKQAKSDEAIANLEKAVVANPKNSVIKQNLERLRKKVEKNR